MKASSFSFALLLASLAACGSGPDPSTTGGDVESLLVAPVASGGYVGSTALDGQGHLFLVANEVLQSVSFAPNVALPSTWTAPTTEPEIELAVAGNTIWWAASDGATSSLWGSSEQSFASLSAAPTSFPGGDDSDVVGLVADATAVYAAVSSPEPLSAGQAPPAPWPSPDSWQWPGNPDVDTPCAGAIYQIVPGSTTAAQPLTVPDGITFFPGFMTHVLAQSATEVYWVDSRVTPSAIGRVRAATKAAWATAAPRTIGSVPATPGVATGFVGIAASDTVVAYAVAPEPYYGSSGCWVWASASDGPPKEIFDSDTAATSFLCNGLAVDDTYAYFAMVQVYVPPAGVDSAALLGTGIARVPLAGGPLQTVALQSDRWYGPRRVLVDDTYVYAIDPSYVLRFSKADFGP